jgi:hypothetical protein
MVLPPLDFESSASTNFATSAEGFKIYYFIASIASWNELALPANLALVLLMRYFLK